MERILPYRKLNVDWNELNLSRGTFFNTDRNSTKVKSVNSDFFPEDDNDPIDFDPDDPFESVIDDVDKKKKKYPEKFPKDDSFTDTNLDSTDTEPTDTDITTSTSAESLYSTTTDSSDATESLDPNTEALESPSYHASEDDSDESTDTDYFDSDATTESSEQSYTSLSENVDDSPEMSSASESDSSEPLPPATGGPPETFKWSEDEEMEIPVVKSKGKIFDPLKEMREAGEKKLAPFIEERQKKVQNSGVSGIFASIAKHVAPRNSFEFLSDFSDVAEQRFTVGSSRYVL